MLALLGPTLLEHGKNEMIYQFNWLGSTHGLPMNLSNPVENFLLVVGIPRFKKLRVLIHSKL
jgi:hypothetical protein